MHSPKIYPRKHEIMHENMKNNAKERVIWTYRLMERETLQEIRRKTTKNLLWSLAKSEREREKVLKSFWKSGLNKSNLNFLKTLFSKFDWSKQQFRLIEIDRLHKNFKRNFDCSKKQIGSIKTQRLTKFRKEFRNLSKYWNWWTKFLSMWWNVFQKQQS